MKNNINIIDYSEYWERCWEEEKPEELFSYLEGWNGHKSLEMDVFKDHGVRKVCDAACGFGAHTVALASNGFEVSAFDVSERAVKLTTEGLKKYGYTGTAVKKAEITATGYEEESFDAVTAYAVIDHLTEADSKKAVAELMRIIKPGGLLLLSFDMPEEDDFLCEHDILPDGSMIYSSDPSRAGMIFRPHDGEKIEALFLGYQCINRWTDGKGGQVVVIAK